MLKDTGKTERAADAPEISKKTTGREAWQAGTEHVLAITKADADEQDRKNLDRCRVRDSFSGRNRGY